MHMYKYIHICIYIYIYILLSSAAALFAAPTSSHRAVGLGPTRLLSGVVIYSQLGGITYLTPLV